MRALPRRDKRGRREAAEHVARCRERVVEAERRQYGAGATGALAQIAAEGRLPQPVRDSARRAAKAGRRATVAVIAVTTALTVLFVAAVIVLVVAVL